VPLPTIWLRPFGCGRCSMSFRAHLLDAPLSTMTTSVSCTSSPTPFNINAPSIWRLISILSERRSQSIKSASSMSRSHHSSPTSSRRVFPPWCSMSLDSVSTFTVVELCDRTPLKKQEFVSQDPIEGFSTKRECTNTHISIQYHDI
jgi:hypothetical protein